VLVKSDINFNTLYDVVNNTFLRQGSKAPFNKKKLQHFIEMLIVEKRFVSFAALNNIDEVISVCGIIYDKNSSYLILNGIDIEKQVRGANALMIYETIKYFKNKCQVYDFEGSMLPSVEQFYRRFGGDLTPYMRIWNDNLFNYIMFKAKRMFKKIKYGR